MKELNSSDVYDSDNDGCPLLEDTSFVPGRLGILSSLLWALHWKISGSNVPLYFGHFSIDIIGT